MFQIRLSTDDVCCTLESNVTSIFDSAMSVVLSSVFKTLDVSLIVLKESVLPNNYENDFFLKNLEEYVSLQLN